RRAGRRRLTDHCLRPELRGAGAGLPGCDGGPAMRLPVSLHGVRTISVLELRQRLRTSRWPFVLGIWLLIIGAVAGLTWWAVHDQPGDRGATLYDVVLFFVLGLGMLVVPSLTATSINGDREHGVLATLQTTLLTSADIVLGKLVAAWAISLAF